MMIFMNHSHTLLLFLGKSKEAESKRINKELANIRSKFKGNYLKLCQVILAQKRTRVGACPGTSARLPPTLCSVFLLF